MPAATASGSDAKSNGAAKSRDHNQGNQDRSYTPEQKSEVLRVRKCSPTAFYEILNLESVKTTVTDTEIKKAYRKISLLTHPDKNGHEHADEAFKMVSRAFGVLGDKDKRAKYDRFGGDPDSRFGGGAPQSSPFSGFAGRPPSSRAAGGAGGGSMWEEEISPEEMFNRFFGGGGLGGGFGPFGGGGLFDGGQQFVFNMGGGPGIRVHQFGGARPRRRPRDPNAPAEAPASLQTTLMGLLPLLFILILPILSSLFSGSGSTAAGPSMRFDTAVPPHTLHRHTSRMKVDYYINPVEVEHYTPSQLSKLDQRAEINYIQRLNVECQQEELARQELINDAQGWFYQDAEKMQQARTMEMKSCRRLDSMGVGRNTY
ncbi:hypothetical protein EG329_012299 [Mollisiaceae sp. DMI_Dod_QoI]|nr:hypothetical protein EG329_012299 [Helotiales sp. DMI_Dod_QoI]